MIRKEIGVTHFMKVPRTYLGSRGTSTSCMRDTRLNHQKEKKAWYRI